MDTKLTSKVKTCGLMATEHSQSQKSQNRTNMPVVCSMCNFDKELIRPRSKCPNRSIIDHCHEPDEAQNADMEDVIMSSSTTPIIGIHILFVIIPSLSVPRDFSLTFFLSLARSWYVGMGGWMHVYT